MTIFSKIIRVTFWTVHIFFSSSDRDKKFSDHILNHPAMMQRPENWELKTTVTKQAEITGENSYIPIGNFDIGINLISHYLLVEADCPTKKN
jgi:hypothetical protein